MSAVATAKLQLSSAKTFVPTILTVVGCWIAKQTLRLRMPEGLLFFISAADLGHGIESHEQAGQAVANEMVRSF